MLLIPMSVNQRLQIIVNHKEYSMIRRVAASEKKSLSDWVRGLIRQKLTQKVLQGTQDPIKIFRNLELPSPPIEQMLEEIEKGRH